MAETVNGLYQEFFNAVNGIYNQDEINNIKKAVDFILEKEIIKNNEKTIIHCLNVGLTLVDLTVDYITIMSSFLQECLKLNASTYKELENIFGSEVTSLCDNVSKLDKIGLNGTSESDAITMRRILVGLAKDVRSIFIKLADRLDEMKNLGKSSVEMQKKVALETEEVLIPIAHRLGINNIKSELDDLCLKYLKPDEYNYVLQIMEDSPEKLQEQLEAMKTEVTDFLNNHNLSFKIKGRVKSVHSIYDKLNKGRSFNNIYDILALRIFVDTESECYQVMGLIHSKYHAIPKRFKDYIAKPKANMYQSLHTSVFGVEEALFEIQVRTYEMDEIAEKGVASHWSYKEKGTKKAQNIMEQKLEMFRNVIELNKERSEKDFLESISNEFLSNLIYVYTPKGDVVELPKGSTPIDFAYRIHSNVGDTTVGAIVNDKIEPLSTILSDGDIISIKTSPGGTPNKEWLKFVRTSQAKNKIKAYFSKKDRVTYIERGKEMLEREIKQKKIVVADFMNQENINKLIKDMKMGSIDDIYLSIGSLRYTPAYVVELTREEKVDVEDMLISRVISRSSANSTNSGDINVAGIPNIKVNIASCCKPVVGDEIIGYITKGQGISVHKKTCVNIASEKDRLINVSWNEQTDKYYLTDIFVEVVNDKNHMLDIITRASTKNIFIDDYKSRDNDTTSIYEITVKIKNVSDLETFITDLNNQKYTLNVSRSN